MAYQHDVFLSYKREASWTPWARDHFKPMLESYLSAELGSDARIFLDERIEVGADWIDDLAINLATSKVMVALFSGDYFGSDWCMSELDLMLGRSKECAQNGHSRIIIPIMVHDGELVPDEVSRIQQHDLKAFRYTHLIKTTPLYQEFSIAMSKLGPTVRRAIETAPAFNEGWIQTHKDRFNAVFAARSGGPTVAPQNFVSKPRPSLLSPPRIMVAQ